MSDFVVCTVISKNYLPQARTLMQSFRRLHAERFFVLLVDSLDGYFREEDEDFILITLDELALPCPQALFFQYTILELNTAVKPFFFEYLFQRDASIHKVLYFDPDIYIYQSLEVILRPLETSSLVLTPHVLKPIEDTCRPGEINILQAGTYNLGFIALSRSTTTNDFLAWWKRKLTRGCLMDVRNGFHVDQKWIDLVPGYYDGVHILRHDGCNVAYWNLPTRQISLQDGVYYSNQSELIFFHFSGFDPHTIEDLSIHHDRFTLASDTPAYSLAKNYSDILLRNGYDTCRYWPYFFDKYTNGVKISKRARRLFHAGGDDFIKKFPDPFRAQPDDRKSFFRYQKHVFTHIRTIFILLAKLLLPFLKKSISRMVQLFNGEAKR